MAAGTGARVRTQEATGDPARRARLWVLAGGAALLSLHQGSRLAGLGAASLNADLGIQHYLAQLTLGGAVPLIDFEHGWNTASWYLSALLLWLAGGDPTVWWFLWGPVLGPLAAGLVMLAIAWRLRLPPVWIAALLATWVATLHLPHHKYTIPMLWALALLPVATTRRWWPLTVRVALPAVVWWFHVELALLLAAGTVLYDLFGARDRARGDRLVRASLVGAGILVGAASQVVVYAVLGLAPAEVVRQLLFDQAQVFDRHFGYPLGNPDTFRVLVYPASVILPFAPVVWRRLGDPARLVAFLHLAQALIPIRRPGDGHVGAAATLLVLLYVLIAYDVSRQGLPRWSLPEAWRQRGLAAVAVAAGGLWFTAAVLAGFRIASFLAIVALTVVCLVGVAFSWGGERRWASVGAVAAAVVLVATSFGARSTQQVRASEAGLQSELIAEAARDDVEACLTPSRQAWIVPSPLTLYDELEVTNPTPFYLFWYHFAGERDRIVEMAEQGLIPVIIQPYGWPDSMASVAPVIEERYDLCAERLVDETGNLIRVWRHRSHAR